MAWNDSTPSGYRTAQAAALVLVVAAAAALSGCSVALPRESPINELTQDAPSALQIYRTYAGAAQGAGAAGAQGVGAGSAQERSVRDDFDREAVERTGSLRKVTSVDGDAGPSGRYWSALEPMRQRFAKVPNPDLVMVVYPHLAQGKYPVPGYVTTFPMYEETNYALPGEIQEDVRRSRERFTPTRPSQPSGSDQVATPGGLILPLDAAADGASASAASMTSVRSARR